MSTRYDVCFTGFYDFRSRKCTATLPTDITVGHSGVSTIVPEQSSIPVNTSRPTSTNRMILISAVSVAACVVIVSAVVTFAILYHRYIRKIKKPEHLGDDPQHISNAIARAVLLGINGHTPSDGDRESRTSQSDPKVELVSLVTDVARLRTRNPILNQRIEDLLALCMEDDERTYFNSMAGEERERWLRHQRRAIVRSVQQQLQDELNLLVYPQTQPTSTVQDVKPVVDAFVLISQKKVTEWVSRFADPESLCLKGKESDSSDQKNLSQNAIEQPRLIVLDGNATDAEVQITAVTTVMQQHIGDSISLIDLGHAGALRKVQSFQNGSHSGAERFLMFSRVSSRCMYGTGAAYIGTQTQVDPINNNHCSCDGNQCGSISANVETSRCGAKEKKLSLVSNLDEMITVSSCSETSDSISLPPISPKSDSLSLGIDSPHAQRRIRPTSGNPFLWPRSASMSLSSQSAELKMSSGLSRKPQSPS